MQSQSFGFAISLGGCKLAAWGLRSHSLGFAISQLFGAYSLVMPNWVLVFTRLPLEGAQAGTVQEGVAKVPRILCSLSKKIHLAQGCVQMGWSWRSATWVRAMLGSAWLRAYQLCAQAGKLCAEAGLLRPFLLRIRDRLLPCKAVTSCVPKQ